MLNFDLLPSASVFIHKNILFNDFEIHNIGFHDFKHIKPIYIVRSQSLHTLHFVLDGEGFLQVNNKSYNLKKGDVFYLSPNTPYIYHPNKKNPWKYAWVAVDGKKAADYFSKCLFSKVNVYQLKNADPIHHYLYDFFLNNSSKTLNEEKMFSVFFNLMNMILEEQNTVQNEQTLVEHYAKDIKDAIYCNFVNPEFKIEDIPTIVNLSYPYIIKIFQKSFNVSLKKYLYTMRLEFALNLLLTTDNNVSEIAYRSGFSDPLYFSTSFKKRYNLSPTEYRKQHKAKD